MRSHDSTDATDRTRPPGDGAPSVLRGPRWAVLLSCFFFSGTAALVYQVAWTRQFALVFGSSELAVAAVLAAFLGGLGAGAAVAARFSPRVARPLRVYATLELIIAAAALLVPWGIRLAERLQLVVFGRPDELPTAGGLGSTGFNLAVAFVILVVPTASMGATLPFLTRFAVRQEREIGPATGILYAANTVGGVAGAIAAGFLLLPGVGLRGTVLVGVALNVLAGAAALAAARGAPINEPATGSADRPRTVFALEPRGRVLALLVIASGAVSLAYEVLWTRLLAHLLGGSLYAFSTMLACFLAGIAIGSALTSRLAQSVERGFAGFAIAQLGIAAFTAASYTALGHVHDLAALAWRPERPAGAGVVVAALALLPAAVSIGATFPFAVRGLARRTEHAAPATALVFSCSTVGSILGAIASGLFLLPALGFAGTLAVGVAVNLMIALVTTSLGGSRRVATAALAALGLVALAVWPPATPWPILRWNLLDGRTTAGRVEHHAVGRNATVLLTEGQGLWRLTTNGLTEGTIAPPGIPAGRYQVTGWLGALATLARPDTRSMAVIGLGAGELLEAVPATVQTIDVVELEPEVVRANRAVAARRRRDPLADPRVRLIVNDARSALLSSGKAFDAIVSQPSHPWTSGSAHLYTREFFELVREHLTSGGVFVQWIGMNFIDETLLRSVLATLVEVFPEVSVWRPPTGAALLFVASDKGLDWEAIRRGLGAVRDLPELGIARVEDLAAALVLDTSGARALGAGAPLVRDDRNLLEARSQRVIGRALGRDRGEAVLAPLDPLAGDSVRDLPAVLDGVDRPYLVRRLLDVGHVARARRIAETTTDPIARQVALARLAAEAGQREVALRLCEDALSRDPRSDEARALHLQLYKLQIVRGGEPGLTRLTAIEATVVAAWRSAVAGDWSRVEASDAVLAMSGPGLPLHAEAVRLRAGWRVAAGGPERAREALALVDELLARGRTPEDLLLRAQAAGEAQDARGALSTLEDLEPAIARHPQKEPWARAALGLIDRLPDDRTVADWRVSLRSTFAAHVPQGRAREP